MGKTNVLGTRSCGEEGCVAASQEKTSRKHLALFAKGSRHHPDAARAELPVGLVAFEWQDPQAGNLFQSPSCPCQRMIHKL